MSEVGPGQTLFTFVRFWSRRSELGDPAVADQGRLVLVTEAVHTLSSRGISATVNAVAHEIGLDQSGTSRLIKSAAEAGRLELAASPIDRRQRVASVTMEGRTLLDQAHRWQQEVFDQLAAGWSDRRRRAFLTDLSELMENSHSLDE